MHLTNHPGDADYNPPSDFSSIPVFLYTVIFVKRFFILNIENKLTKNQEFKNNLLLFCVFEFRAYILNK